MARPKGATPPKALLHVYILESQKAYIQWLAKESFDRMSVASVVRKLFNEAMLNDEKWKKHVRTSRDVNIGDVFGK